MTGPLEILEIASQPWCWLPELDGVPTRGGAEYIQPLDHVVQTDRGAGDREHRHFSYSFVAAMPDVSFDRVPVNIRQFASVLAEIETAVFSMICGQRGGTEALRRSGEALSRLLLPEWVMDALFAKEEGTPLVIRPDELAAAIPFELCYHQGVGRFLGEHRAVSRGIATRRHHANPLFPATQADGSSLMDGGAIVLNPEGDPRLNRRTEAIAELYAQLASPNGRRVEVHSRSAFPEMLSLLGSPFYLYTGHIRFEPQTGSFIECADGHRLMASEIGARLRGGRQPVLAVLNGCGGDRSELDIAGHSLSSATRSSFARNFYEAGVQMVVGARWEVDLDTAWALNRHLLGALIQEAGLPMGEVMRRFRQSGSPGWPCYVMYGDPRRILHVRSGGKVTSAAGRSTHSVQITMPTPPRPVPSSRRPLIVGLLLDTAKRDLAGSEDPRVEFLQAIGSEIANLDARLAPNSGESVCRLVLEGWPHPLGKGRQRVDLSDAKELLGDADKQGRLRGGLSDALMRLRDRIRREWVSVEPEGPLPLAIIQLAPGSLDSTGTIAEAVRLCDDLRLCPRPAGREINTLPIPIELWVVACDPKIPQDLVLTLAGGETRRVGKLMEVEDAIPLAADIFEEQRTALSRKARTGRNRRNAADEAS